MCSQGLSRFIVIITFIIVIVSGTVLAQGDNGVLIVSPDGPYVTIEEALADATEGDMIEVHGGVYGTPLTISVPGVSLIGIGNPAIDGQGEGSLVIIDAPDVVFRGFTVRNTGHSLMHEDTGIVIQATGVLVEDNLLEEVLFGIYLANADYSIARNNIVRGVDLDDAMRGDGIRVWYSNFAVLDGNEVTISRDTLIWFANDITIENNSFIDNRYGLHFMYSDDALVQRNTFQGNSVGTYLMHSYGLTLIENIMSYNRGPSGYGLALKDMDDVIVTDNLFVGNRAGMYFDNSPSEIDTFNVFTGNVLVNNDIGLIIQPSVKNNIFHSNSFMSNLQQVGTRGNGTLQGNIWDQDGIGNYWSDYAGYDAEDDGIGDTNYRYDKLFDNIIDNYPSLRLFTFSPAAQAVNFTAMAFPSFRPEPKLVDDAPMINYVLPEFLITDDGSNQLSLPLLSVSLLLVGLSVVIFVFALSLPVPFGRTEQSKRHVSSSVTEV
jgi:nitrous oxidase accessory protein